MSTKALIFTPIVFLATISVASALTFTWDPDPPPAGTTAPAQPTQWEIVMTRAQQGSISQLKEPLTLLDDSACQAIYDQAGEPAFQQGTSHCATIACPGAGAYTALLHDASTNDVQVKNSSSFGLDAQCKMVPYEQALMDNLPSGQPQASTGSGTTPKPGTDMADGSQPSTDQGDTSDTSNDQGDTTSTGSGTTPKPSTGGTTPATTGSGPTGGTHVASLPAPRVLDIDAPTSTSTSPSSSGTTSSSPPTSGTTSSGQTGTGSTSTPSTGSTGSGATPATTTGAGSTPAGSPTSSTGSPSTPSPTTGSTTGQPASAPPTTLTGSIDATVKALQQISSDYDKARKALEDKTKQAYQAALQKGGTQVRTALSQIFAQAVQDDAKLYQDTLTKWDAAYAKLPTTGTTPSNGGGNTPAGAGTPVAQTSPTRCTGTAATDGSCTGPMAGSGGTGSAGSSAPATSGMSTDPATSGLADAGDTARDQSSTSGQPQSRNGSRIQTDGGINYITVTGTPDTTGSGGSGGMTVREDGGQSSAPARQQTASTQP